MLAAVSCRLLAACSVRALRSWLPEAISPLATSMPPLDCCTWPTRVRIEVCMAESAPIRLLGSCAGGVAPLRSPSAMRRKALRAMAGSPPISRLSVRCTTSPSTTAAERANKARPMASARARSASALTCSCVCVDSACEALPSCSSSPRSLRQAGVSSVLSICTASGALVFSRASTLSCAWAWAVRKPASGARPASAGVPLAAASVVWWAASKASRAASRFL